MKNRILFLGVIFPIFAAFDDGTVFKFEPSSSLREGVDPTWHKRALAQQNLLNHQYRAEILDDPAPVFDLNFPSLSAPTVRVVKH